MERTGLELSDLHRAASVTSPRIHPDGQGGVFVVRRANEDGEGYTSCIVFGDAHGTRDMTYGPDDRHPAFSADGRTLFFVRGDETHGDQVMALPVQGGEAAAFGPRFYGVAGITPVPGRDAVVIAARGTGSPPANAFPRHYQRFQWQYDGVGYFPGAPVGLFWVEAGQDAVRITDSPYDLEPPAADPHGRFLLTAGVADEARAREAGPDIFAMPLPAEAPAGPLDMRRLTRGPGRFARPAAAADGRIYCYGDTGTFGPATSGSVFQVSERDGAVRMAVPDELWVGAALSSDWNAAAGLPRPVPTGDGVLVLASHMGRTGIFRVKDSGTCTALELPVPVAHEMDGGDAGLLITAAGPERPVEAYLLRDGEVHAASAVNVWAHELLYPLEALTITAKDGLGISAYLVGDPGNRPGPTILYVHGGPHGAYGETARFDAQVMARRGYQVLMVNPRGSMSYGQAFADAVRGDWGGGDREDLMAILDLAVERGIADPERLYITGGSYGGFQTAFTVGHTDRFRAASTAVPVINLVSFYGTSDIGWWFTEGEIRGDPWHHLERLWDFSPLKYAEFVKTPTQVVAGEDDRRCPIEQAEQYYTALKHFGVETEFLRYPGPHGFGSTGRPRLRQDRLKRLLDWFDAHR
ncbi:MAG: prolyl oligopeptidase family serine peptidase [Clostridia bacterium]